MVNILLGVADAKGIGLLFARRRQSEGERRKKGRRMRDLLISLVILMAVAFAAGYAARFAEEEIAGNARVIDGDTLSINASRVRLVGLDAPELAQTCNHDGRQVECGRQSRDHLAALIDGGPVNCEGWEVDRYGRLLARCRARGLDLNAAMVRDGWAIADRGHDAAENEARRARRGIWAYDFRTPREWRAVHGAEDGPEADAVPPELSRALRRALTVGADWIRSFLEAN